jgi:hypothetical protein
MQIFKCEEDPKCRDGTHAKHRDARNNHQCE